MRYCEPVVSQYGSVEVWFLQDPKDINEALRENIKVAVDRREYPKLMIQFYEGTYTVNWAVLQADKTEWYFEQEGPTSQYQCEVDGKKMVVLELGYKTAFREIEKL